jgi:diacylglycerol kinase family enzyme
VSTGTLGVFAINARTGKDAASLVAMSAIGGARKDPNLHGFTTERFEVRSRSGTANAGVDGEALTLDTPLTFQIHPGGMTVLVPPDNPRVSTTKHYRAFGVSGLWDLARGREVGVPGLPE